MSRNKHQKKQPSYAELQAQVEELNNRNQSLIEQLQKFHPETHTESASSTLTESLSFSAAGSQTQEFNERIEVLNAEHAKEVASFLTRISDHQLEITELESKITDLIKELDNAKESLSKMPIAASRPAEDENEQIILLREQVDKLTSELEIQRSEYEKLLEAENRKFKALESQSIEKLEELAQLLKEAKEEIQKNQQTIQKMKETIDSTAVDTVTPPDSVVYPEIEAETSRLVLEIQRLNKRNQDLENESTLHKEQMQLLTKELNAVKLLLRSEEEKVLSLSAEPAKTSNIYPIFFAEAQARQKRAEDAIERLKALVSKADQKSEADKAILGIAECLNQGIKSDHAQAYFDSNKDLLEKHIGTLQYSFSSILNTVINAILTVFAVCSVVGITALWLTGTLQHNAQKNGSSFAFMTFGRKQKVQREMHEVESAMCLGMSNGS